MFYLRNSLFGVIKLSENPDHDQHSYFGCVSSFDVRETFSLPNGGDFGKNVVIFGTDISSSVYFHNKKKLF